MAFLHTRWRFALALAVLTYSFLCAALILQNPGLQYDESLLVLGAVHMRHSHQEITLPHDPHTWLCLQGRCLPLMTVRYVGAIKEYLCLPFFAFFGTTAEVVRGTSVFLGAIGIWGLGWLLARQVSPETGVVTAWALAIHPAYVDLTSFDNGTVAVWMAAMGLLALAVSRYCERRDRASALLLGIAMGFGVWARSNFLWLLAAIAVAAVVTLRRRAIPAPANLAAMAAGVGLGAAPWIVYQAISRGGTFEAVGMFTLRDSWKQILSSRTWMLAETLISDREHRAIWNGPELPAWQSMLALGTVLAACVVCLRQGGWARAIAVTFLLLGAMFFFTRLPVAEHHLIVLIPLAAVMVALLPARAGRVVGALFVFCALWWQVSAIRGIGETGGVGQWSDGIYALTDYLEQRAQGREVQILDWGLQNSIYVLSDARVKTREVFDSGRDWGVEIRKGGLFVMNTPNNRFFPEATNAFLSALQSAAVSPHHSVIPGFAEIIEIAPASPGGTQDGTSRPAGE